MHFQFEILQLCHCSKFFLKKYEHMLRKYQNYRFSSTFHINIWVSLKIFLFTSKNKNNFFSRLTVFGTWEFENDRLSKHRGKNLSISWLLIPLYGVNSTKSCTAISLDVFTSKLPIQWRLCSISRILFRGFTSRFQYTQQFFSHFFHYRFVNVPFRWRNTRGLFSHLASLMSLL